MKIAIFNAFEGYWLICLLQFVHFPNASLSLFFHLIYISDIYFLEIFNFFDIYHC